MKTVSVIVMCSVLVVAFCPVAVGADGNAKAEVGGLWNTEAMMDQAAKNIGDRYNLNDAQREYTHKMLTERVNKFLNGNDGIWPLIRDLARHQMSGKTPEGTTGMRIGGAALPLVAEIHEAILDANEQWRRECLTPQQRKMHDWDLRDIERTFGTMKMNFQAMAEGVPVDQGIFPKPDGQRIQPVRPPKPANNHKPPRYAEATRVYMLEDSWARHVEEFIRRYQLDDAQSEAALSILRDCQARARQYRRSKKEEFAEAAKKTAELRETGSTLSRDIRNMKRRWIDKKERSLNKPIRELFKELQSRLDRLPTDAQRLRADVHRKNLRRAGKTGTTTKPAPPAATREPERPKRDPAPTSPDRAATPAK